jgi:hypothetical protein
MLKKIFELKKDELNEQFIILNNKELLLYTDHLELFG